MERTEHCGYTDLHGLSRIRQDLLRSHSNTGGGSGASSNTTSHSSTDDLSPANMLRTAIAKSRPIHVGIVGAGFAGLRCADVLLQHGCRVTIFEARNRVGGRVAQSEHLGYPIDMGPNWIHGSDDNPILHLARSTNTTLHSWGEEQAMFDVDGSPLSPDECEEYSSLLWDDGVIKAAFEYSNKYRDSIAPEKSLYDFFEEKAQEMFADEAPAVAARKRATFLQCTALWGAYIGSPVTRQSLKFFWLEECIEGENPFVAGTYGKILHAVAQAAVQKATIHLNEPVTRVVSQQLDSASESKEPQIAVHTANGASHQFDEVIVTTPLGWLKRNKSAFEPALPPRLSQAIDNISYGHLDKVYITFPSAFWDVPVESPSSQTGADTNHATSPLQPPNDHYPGFLHWLQPTYANSTNPSQWDQECMNLASLRAPCAQPTLLFYIYGAQSEHIGALVRAHAHDPAARDAALLAHFAPYIATLPNYSPARPDCTPSAVLATTWVNDEWAGHGSYANFQVGLEDGDQDIEVMRTGLPDRRLWLAGEHTAPFVALGTTTGAYWSGEKVAQRIVRAYGLEGENAAANGAQ